MKALIGLVVLLVLFGGGFYLSQSQPGGAVEDTVAPQHSATEGESESALQPAPGRYAVSPAESTIAWSAGKPLIAGYVHTGTFAVQSGAIDVGENTASGNFVIDMNSVKVTSLGGGKAGKESALEGHLKKDDFFGVEKFPTASFVIASIVPTGGTSEYTVTGTLTMKDIANDVSFPARIYMENGKLHAHADFTIDRTKWGITFASASVFDNLANNAVGDEVTLSLKLIADPVTE